MNRARTHRQGGFTLVEILIVVIILGILAAIVIPQFTNASQDARKSSLTSQLQTVRSQLEFYKLQHHDNYPTDTGLITGLWDWAKLTTKTDADGGTTGSILYGPYLQSTPINPIVKTGVDGTAMATVNADPTFPSSTAVTEGGWVLSTATGKIYATTKSGTQIYNEADPSDPNNEN